MLLNHHLKINGTLFVIAAPSGAGKTTLVNAVCTKFPHIRRVVTYTTRPPRAGEQQGQAYHFISTLEFQQKVQEDFFIEWSTAYGASYGSSKTVLSELEKGISQIIIVDAHGVQAYATIPQAVVIWIDVSKELLEKRLVSRGLDDQKSIQKRLEISEREQQSLSSMWYKYRIENDDYERSMERLSDIIEYELQNT